MFFRFKKFLRRIYLSRILEKNAITCENIDTTEKSILLNRIGGGVYLGKNVMFPMGLTKGYIGDYTYINSGLIYDDVWIGKYCSFGFNISVAPGKHYVDRISTYPVKIRVLKENWDNVFPDRKKTVIGNDVWIGNNATIMQGVSIGNGAVIGAGAVVTKDVPPYAIVAGIPAKIIRYRFDDETIIALNRIQWWDWDIEKIRKHSNVFLQSGEALQTEIANMLRQIV